MLNRKMLGFVPQPNLRRVYSQINVGFRSSTQPTRSLLTDHIRRKTVIPAKAGIQGFTARNEKCN